MPSSAGAFPWRSWSSSATRTRPPALAVLTESRLVTVDEGTVEVAHEALLREWPRLRGWLEEDAEGRRLHQHLIHAAAEWSAPGAIPPSSTAAPGSPRRSTGHATHDPELNELERAFLDASTEASEREAERQRRAVRRLRTLLAGVGVLLAAAVVAGVIALSERQGARSAATVADAQRTRRPGRHREASTRRCGSRPPASPSTTRSPPAPASYRRCFATPRRSASSPLPARSSLRSR